MTTTPYRKNFDSGRVTKESFGRYNKNINHEKYAPMNVELCLCKSSCFFCFFSLAYRVKFPSVAKLPRKESEKKHKRGLGGG